MMPQNDFFSTFDPAGAVKDITALAMKKQQLDEAAGQFKQEMLMKKQTLDLENQKFEMAKDQITKKNRIEAAVKEKMAGMMAPKEVQTPDASALQTSENINAAAPAWGFQVKSDLAPTVTKTVDPQFSPLRMAEERYKITGDPADLKEVVAARKSETDAARLEKSQQDTDFYRNETLRLKEAGLKKQKDSPSTVLKELQDVYGKEVTDKMTPTEKISNFNKIRPKKESAGMGGGSAPLTEDSATMEGAKYILTGKLPFTGMSGKGRTDMINSASSIAKEHGWTPNMVLRMQSDYKSMDKSVSNQRKNYDMMNGFVINMDRQMARIEKDYAQIPRSQYRLLNIPFVDLRQRAMGSGEEASAAAILIELGNESGKLSTNSASSIRELSESAQKQWAKIHDNKLSFNDLKKVLDTTRGLGHDRLASTKEAMDFTLSGIEALGTSTSVSKPAIPEGGAKGRDTSPAVSYLKGGTREDAIKKIRALSEKGWSKDELTSIAKDAGWE
jgi:hypothetical protein